MKKDNTVSTIFIRTANTTKPYAYCSLEKQDNSIYLLTVRQKDNNIRTMLITTTKKTKPYICGL